MELCRGFSVAKWRKLRKSLQFDTEEAWEEAISVFERRMKERFFRCIDLLLASERGAKLTEPVVPGFAIMALCCMLAETLQSFYEDGQQTNLPAVACTYPTGGCAKEPSTARAFKDFLRNSPHFKNDFRNSQIRGDFSQQVRNALLHEAETRKGWLIEKTWPRNAILVGRHGSYVLNRTKFYQALLAEFGDYLTKLRKPTDETTRVNFLRKMDSLCLGEPKTE